MTHIFKPGDRAYSLRTLRWVELIENGKGIKRFYPLKEKDSDETYMQDGRYDKMQGAPCLVPLNPYDPTDPKNPPEFKSDWPFILRGRRLGIGMEILVQGESGIVPARVQSLLLTRAGVSAGVRYSDGRSAEVWPPVILFPDEVPSKKKVAKWAYLIIGIPGVNTVGFTEEMTEEEARKGYGTSVQMIPGTEREVEG